MGDDEYVIALDYESAGGVPFRNGFTQLGAALVRIRDGAILAKFSEYANMRGYEWDLRCVREFWEKNPELYEETKKMTSDENTPSTYEVVRAFLQWVDMETRGSIRDKVYFISDNAPFDLAIFRAFSERDILYLFGEYRQMVDVSCVYRGMSRRKVGLGLMNESSRDLAREVVSDILGGPFEPKIETEHDHHAVNDAINMAQYWAAIQRALPK
jgi:hypothetical protein